MKLKSLDKRKANDKIIIKVNKYSLLEKSLAQILKEKVKERIEQAAIEAFYQKGFVGTKMQMIAREADISVGLTYSYFTSKEELFASIVDSLYQQIINMMEHREPEAQKELPEDNLFQREPQFILQLLQYQRKPFLILMDQSKGTAFENARDKIVEVTCAHIKRQLSPKVDQEYYHIDDIFYHILANNFIEGLLEIARHYQGKPWAENMLNLLIRQYFYGVKGFHRGK